MKPDLYERIRNYGEAQLQEIKDIGSAAGVVLGVSIPCIGVLSGVMYFLESNFEEIRKSVEWVASNPYETLIGVAGVTALGVGTYRYIERKLHVAKTLDDFVEQAKRSGNPVDVHFQWGHGLQSYDESLMLRSGKMRYEHSGRCDIFGSLARAKATSVLSLVERAVRLAESLEKKGLVVRVRGGTINDAKEYLTKYKEWVRKGFAFIEG